jgi:preprotein translocase subunit SecG
MEQVLLVVQVLIAIALIGMVLIQRSDSDGFGMSGGAGNNLLSGRAAANLRTRITAILAAFFIINSLALSVLAAHGRAPSIVDTIEKQQGDAKDVAPAVPVAGESKTQKTDAKKPTLKADEKKAETKDTAPAVPAADADAKPVAEEKPVAPVKKPAKKAKVVTPAADAENTTDSNDNQ